MDAETLKEQMPEAESLTPTAEGQTQPAPEDKTPWYALKLYSVRQKAACQWFEEQGIEHFVPKHYVDVELEGRVKHILRPVVSNLIFVKKTMEANAFRQFIFNAQLKMAPITKSRTNREICEIPAREMWEFKVMCNPEIELRKYLTEQEAKLKEGAPVLVKYGPLKGLSGKLVRQSKKYYLLKEVPGMAVMLKVSRWCCVPMKDAPTPLQS